MGSENKTDNVDSGDFFRRVGATLNDALRDLLAGGGDVDVKISYTPPSEPEPLDEGEASPSKASTLPEMGTWEWASLMYNRIDDNHVLVCEGARGCHLGKRNGVWGLISQENNNFTAVNINPMGALGRWDIISKPKPEPKEGSWEWAKAKYGSLEPDEVLDSDEFGGSEDTCLELKGGEFGILYQASGEHRKANLSSTNGWKIVSKKGSYKWALTHLNADVVTYRKAWSTWERLVWDDKGEPFRAGAANLKPLTKEDKEAMDWGIVDPVADPKELES